MTHHNMNAIYKWPFCMPVNRIENYVFLACLIKLGRNIIISMFTERKNNSLPGRGEIKIIIRVSNNRVSVGPGIPFCAIGLKIFDIG